MTINWGAQPDGRALAEVCTQVKSKEFPATGSPCDLWTQAGRTCQACEGHDRCQFEENKKVGRNIERMMTVHQVEKYQVPFEYELLKLIIRYNLSVSEVLEKLGNLRMGDFVAQEMAG